MGMTGKSSDVNWANYSETPAICSLRHMSFRCFDAEETRAFYEDFLGLEFTAAVPTQIEIDGKTVDALHVFFRMADGDFMAFYDVPDDLQPDMFRSLSPMDLHMGMKVGSEAEMMTWLDKIKERGYDYLGPLDHGFVRSIYFNDPNGLWLEVTYQVDQHEEILGAEMSNANEQLREWTIKSAPAKEKFRKAS